ncbi:MAG: dihydrodipicolinate synthase family protein [Chloroflexi bacterium]|nr:dihydrodipicolinate synthase family protein [Chloroflexota bacterium]
MIKGIIPILFTPFAENGDIDADGLRRIARFELDGGVHAIGINGFASEAYKLTDAERHLNVEIVAGEAARQVPLVIGLAAGSTEAAMRQARELEKYQPAAYMVLPPATMDNGSASFVDHYVDLGGATDVPIIVQQAPHIPGYRHTELAVEALAEIADRAPGVRYYKIEGPGSADKMKDLAPLLPPGTSMFGGGGGITALGELQNGAAGLIPGVGFNEIFIAAWDRWRGGEPDAAVGIIQAGDALVKAVSGSGHETSLHLRKHLMKRAGYIGSAAVRRPTVAFDENALPDFFKIVDELDLRVSKG